MPLTTVTITGADDSTDPEKLLELWDSFSFVEFGILVGSRVGPRFPSLTWIKNLLKLRGKECSGRSSHQISLHMCGKYLDSFIAGDPTPLVQEYGYILDHFQRIQLNFHGESQPDRTSGWIADSFRAVFPFSEPELIFQLDAVNDRASSACVGLGIACSGLFDQSHGAGVEPESWPAHIAGMKCGWSGGLGPENLARHLPAISRAADPSREYWVDMETKVRTNGQLDLIKVSRCLEIAAEHMRQECSSV